MFSFCTLAHAEPAASATAPAAPFALGDDGDKPTMDELREHAATITDILKTASERVEELAAAETEAPALVDAIKQELSLSRRWNRHLATILLEVADERRALNEREREAAKDIARITAVAEEARLELIALKKVLNGRPTKAAGDPEERSDGESFADGGRRMASNAQAIDAVTADLTGPGGDLADARTALASMQEAQKSAARDVDAVRAKIIDALQALASVQGDLPIGQRGIGPDLSSEDITGWAASMATRLHKGTAVEAD